MSVCVLYVVSRSDIGFACGPSANLHTHPQTQPHRTPIHTSPPHPSLTEGHRDQLRPLRTSSSLVLLWLLVTRRDASPGTLNIYTYIYTYELWADSVMLLHTSGSAVTFWFFNLQRPTVDMTIWLYMEEYKVFVCWIITNNICLATLFILAYKD